nr:hypothetical protein [Tanacetum cinerariifolium]
MDYSGLNKVCTKDMYPLSKEGEELASLMGYLYKCFLQLPKEYIQIKMVEEEEEKIGFHTDEGVYYFTHMPKELKNFAATLQRMMEKQVHPEACEAEAPPTKLGKLPTLVIPKEGEDLMLCLRQKNETISSMLLVKREGTQIPVSCVSRLLGMKICYTLTEKRVQTLIHTTRAQRTVIRKHKVKVVTNGPMEETLKLSGREGRLGKWATKIRTYNISYVQRKEVKGSVIRKFFGRGEQVEKITNANEGERST